MPTLEEYKDNGGDFKCNEEEKVRKKDRSERKTKKEEYTYSYSYIIV